MWLLATSRVPWGEEEDGEKEGSGERSAAIFTELSEGASIEGDTITFGCTSVEEAATPRAGDEIEEEAMQCSDENEYMKELNILLY